MVYKGAISKWVTIITRTVAEILISFTEYLPLNDAIFGYFEALKGYIAMYALNNAVYIYHLAQTVRFGIKKMNQSKYTLNFNNN